MELTASRARIVATADETRRRIERDLHDGAQQELVSLVLELGAARATVPPELAELRAELDRVADGLNRALDELREFARGIHPSVLTKGGLRPALRALARRCALPVELEVRVADRPAPATEVAAYYVVSEALANAVKHARATSVDVEVVGDDRTLHVCVRDDGIGGAGLADGSGLVGLKDRVEAVGGRIELRSQPGAGTTVSAEFPLPPERHAGSAPPRRPPAGRRAVQA
jgi:signal transduction histidine kinase